jgi:hypothetical protein
MAKQQGRDSTKSIGHMGCETWALSKSHCTSMFLFIFFLNIIFQHFTFISSYLFQFFCLFFSNYVLVNLLCRYSNQPTTT